MRTRILAVILLAALVVGAASTVLLASAPSN